MSLDRQCAPGTVSSTWNSSPPYAPEEEITVLILSLFRLSVVSDPLWCHGLQHARLPCPSLSLRVCSNSSPLSQWHHLILHRPLLLLSVSWLFSWCDQSIEASAPAPIPPVNIQGLLPLGLINLISFLFKGPPKIFSNTTVESSNSLALSLLYILTLISICDYWKNHSFNYKELCQQSDVFAF